MSKEYKANRYVHEKMFPHIANMQRANEKIACFTEDDLKEAYIQGWNESVLDIKRSANIKIAEADEYARQKINEAYGEVVLNYAQTISKLLKNE